MLVAVFWKLDTLLCCGCCWPVCPQLQQAGWNLDLGKNFPVDLVGGETAGSNWAWEKGDPKALSSLVVLGGSAERP